MAPNVSLSSEVRDSQEERFDLESNSTNDEENSQLNLQLSNFDSTRDESRKGSMLYFPGLSVNCAIPLPSIIESSHLELLARAHDL